MSDRSRALVGMLAAIVCIAAANSVAAQEDRWRLRISGVGATPTGGGDQSSALGGALGVEYRFSPRLGVEIGGLTIEPQGEEVDANIITVLPLSIDSTYRMTPLLARLNLHLTPGRPVDLYAGPVAGYVHFSDVRLRYHSGYLTGPTFTSSAPAEADDQVVWGGALGLDVPLGQGGACLTLGGTYLQMPLEVRDRPGTIRPAGQEVKVAGVLRPDGNGGFRGDVDPLVFHVGLGLRF